MFIDDDVNQENITLCDKLVHCTFLNIGIEIQYTQKMYPQSCV